MLERKRIDELLTLAWIEVLGAGPDSLNDDFFELGGDSLLAMQLLFLIERDIGVHLVFTDLAEEPSRAGLADTIERKTSPTLSR